MSTPGSLRPLALQQVLAAAAVLVAIASPAAALAQDKTNSGAIALDTINADSSYLNLGTINNPSGTALYGAASVKTVTNAPGASIASGGSSLGAVAVIGDLDAFINDGSVSSTLDALFISGKLASVINNGVLTGGYSSILAGEIGEFVNGSTATISSTLTAIDSLGGIASFTNAGTIASATSNGIAAQGHVGTFVNLAGGEITGRRGVSIFDGNPNDAIHSTVDTFENAGTITGTGDYAAFFADDVGSFANFAGGHISGVATSTARSAVYFGGVTTSFFNAGTIEATGGDGGVITFDGRVTRLVNANGGEIRTSTALAAIGFAGAGAGWIENAGLISNSAAGRNALIVSGTIDMLHNTASGRIESAGVTISSPNDRISLVNEGVVTSSTAAVIATASGATTIVNAGTLGGGGGTAVALGSAADKLTILTGSKIVGALSFGTGNDTLDFAGFAGSTTLDVAGLETLVPGTKSYFDLRDANGDGRLAIFDLTALGHQAIGQSLLDMLLGSNALISGQLRDSTSADAVPMSFALTASPASATTALDTAVLSELDVGQPGARVWGGAVAGGSIDAALNSNAYGGIVFGSHAALADQFTLGGTAGYVVSHGSDSGSTQALSSQTGFVGIYGRTELATADLDFSLLGGASAHTSRRDVTNGADTETATGLFNSIFLAPSLGVALPVLSGDAGDLAVKASATYVGGMTSAYTETGSSLNLAIGAQLISVFDGRIGLEHRKTLGAGELVAKAGVLAQLNAGSASVPVTAFGETISVAAPGGSTFGAYGGIGYEAALSDSLDLALALDGSIRTDGRGTAALELSLGGSF